MKRNYLRTKPKAIYLSSGFSVSFWGFLFLWSIFFFFSVFHFVWCVFLLYILLHSFFLCSFVHCSHEISAWMKLLNCNERSWTMLNSRLEEVWIKYTKHMSEDRCSTLVNSMKCLGDVLNLIWNDRANLKCVCWVRISVAKKEFHLFIEAPYEIEHFY